MFNGQDIDLAIETACKSSDDVSQWPRPRALCGECGEYWPCSDSRRRDISPAIVAKHFIARRP